MSWFQKYQMIEQAATFARRAHESVNQKRKYSGEPYFVHCAEVADLLIEHAAAPCEVVAAALLHDVVEDTPVTNEQIRELFGDWVADLVSEVTDVSKPGDGNRATRKAIDRQHLAKASYWGATIKYADLIANTRDIVKQDSGFARVYLEEKYLLLLSMKQGHPGMRCIAIDVLKESWKKIFTEELVVEKMDDLEREKFRVRAEKAVQLLYRVEKFIDEHNLTSAEPIYQYDTVMEQIPYLVSELCGIVGYKEIENEENIMDVNSDVAD